jgi:predicted DNA-binding transcriptional regulator YafY
VNRTERLYAMTEELRRAGPRGRTSQRLAEHFEVSVRTVKRDITALQQAGVPIWAAPGPGGGYVLDAAATLPPVNFTPAQAVAVATALATQHVGPYTADGEAALAKVLDVMDARSRRRAEDLAARVWVRGGTPAQRWPAVEEALSRQVVVALDYVDAQGVATRRRVEPLKLARTDGHWYLIGWCLARDAVRWFRWDRIRAAHLTTEPAAGRDLAVVGTPPADAQPVITPRR